jgi:hypothetical protein
MKQFPNPLMVAYLTKTSATNKKVQVRMFVQSLYKGRPATYTHRIDHALKLPRNEWPRLPEHTLMRHGLAHHKQKIHLGCGKYITEVTAQDVSAVT